MDSKIKNYYVGKTILLTGTTGFVGKVILEKVLRSLPVVKEVILLMRRKEGKSVTSRFINATISSPLFSVLKKQLGADFDQYIKDKVKLIEGDLLAPNLGLSQEDRVYIENNCEIVLNCAASIDFNALLKDSIQVNVLGTLKMYELSKNCKKLENFIHISTTYVNSDKQGFIEENVYDGSIDPEVLLKRLMDMDEKELIKQTPVLLGRYPNTYTYTKSLVERIMKKVRPQDMTITIIRPSIVGSTYKEPFKGWVENIAASTAVFAFIGLGICRYVTSSDKLISDITPVDFVASYCVIGGALFANKNTLNVCNAGTSAANPCTWGEAKNMVELYWQNSPPEKKVAEANIQFFKTNRRTQLVTYTRQTLPVKIYKNVAEKFGTVQMQKDANRAFKVSEKSTKISKLFAHFSGNEWVFDNKNAKLLQSLMSEEEKEQYWLDATQIDWKDYLIFYQWGIQKFIMNENVAPPLVSELLLKSKKTYFSDIQWALEKGKTTKYRAQSQYKSMVLNSQKVINEINALIELRSQQASKMVKTHKQISHEKIKQQCKQDAIKLANEMIADYTMSILRVFAWTLHKVFRSIYERVIIDDSILKQLQHHDEKIDGPILYIPTHRSYIDFLIVSYVLFAYKISCPHIAAAEDFLKMAIVPQFLRMSGAFFLRRKLPEELQPLYKAMLNEYITRLLIDNSSIEFFIEGTRSRNFKTLSPKFGILGTVVDAVADDKVKNALIIPLTINYEKVLEEDTYPYELMGEEKVKESTMRLIKASKTLAMNYGKIFIEFCEPIPVKKYLQDNSTLDRKQIINNLGYDITYAIQDSLIITVPSIVASILLMHRKGIMEHILVSKVEWLVEKIQERGANVGGITTLKEHSGVSQSVRSAILLLQNNLIRSKKTVFEMSVAPLMDFKNILMLSYYRNGLHHLFVHEAIFCAALGFFGQQQAKNGVQLDKYWKETQFLLQLLQKEHVSRRQINNFEQFKEFLQIMHELKVFIVDEEQQTVRINDEQMFSFLCSQVWSTIESYWITCVYFFTLKQNKHHIVRQMQMPQYVQWFGENLYDENILEYTESCSLDQLKNAVQNFIELGVIIIENEQNIKNQGIARANITEEALTKLETHISKFLKRNYITNVVTSPMDLARRTVLVEYNPKL